MWKASLTADRSRIQDYLETDRRYAAFAIGDLEPRLFAQSTFAVAEVDGRIGALAQHFRGIAPTPLQLMGENGGLKAILSDVLRPAQPYVVGRPEHVPVVEEFYEWDGGAQMLRMGLRGEEFRGASTDCVRLTADDLASLTDLYTQGDVNSFHPERLEHNVFYGVFEDEQLVAAAGTHLVSPTYGVAAVASVYTRPECRGRGYGTATTSAVVFDLVRRGIQDVVLTVGHDNEGAIRVYERLGFERHCPIVGGRATRVR
jgi:ribosomal protein S18 acetylase RimI-like enzyme